jgi:RNA polymerase-binding transcription factor
MTDPTTRISDLWQMLRERQRQMQADVETRLRDERVHRPIEVRDQLEHSDDNSQADIDLALLQMRTETLARIDQALARLDAGQYGACVECGHDISERRLNALPFAVRCQPCEEVRERKGHPQQTGPKRSGASPFALAGRVVDARA